jgi:hypothetical protein
MLRVCPQLDYFLVSYDSLDYVPISIDVQR